MNILLIGMTGKAYLPYYIANELEKQGHTVFRVACTENSKEDAKPYNYNVMEQVVKKSSRHALLSQAGSLYIDINEIIEYFKLKNIKFDLIYYQQTNFYPKFKDIHIPIIYNYTQRLKPYFPVFGNVKKIITAFPEGINNLKRPHSPEIYNIKNKVINWGYNSEIYPLKQNFNERDIYIGFKGSTSIEGGIRAGDYEVRHIYDDRIRIIDKCKKIYKDKFVFQQPEHYLKEIEFIHRVKFALNIPGTACYFNQRSYYIMGCGCVLLQYDNRYLKEYGFIDGVNCIIFKNVDEIADKIHSYDIDKIRKNGIEFANNNTYKHRSKEIVDYILK